MLTDNDIERIVRRIVHHQRPLAVGLFGSYAMRTAHESSDLDLFLVRNCVERGPARTLAVRRLLIGVLHPLDIHVFTPAEFEQQVNESQSFAWHIARQAKLCCWVKDAMRLVPSLFREMPSEGRTFE